MRIRFNRDARESAEKIGGVAVPYGPSQRAPRRWRWYLVLLLVFSPILYLLATVLSNWLTHTANGSVSLAQYEIRAPADGYVDLLASPVGVDVGVGEVVVRLRSPPLEATLAGLAMEQRDRDPATAVVPAPRPQQETELAALRRTLAWREQRLAAVHGLFEQGAATQAEVNEAMAAAEQAAVAVSGMERSRAGAAASPARGNADAGDRRIDRDRALAEQRLATLTVRAEYEGRVIDLFVSPGEFVGAGQPLLLIGRSQAPSITAFVEPGLALSLEPGAQATVRFPDGSQAVATVTEIPRLTRRLPSNLVDQFGLRPMTVVMELSSDRPWSDRQLIHGLPVSVRFHYTFERALHRLFARAGDSGAAWADQPGG